MKTILNGKVVKDPEIKYFDTGKSVTDFAIAVNGFRDGQKTTSFFNCQIWDDEFVYNFCKKGHDLTVNGYVKKDVYVNKKGEEKSSIKIVAQKVSFGGSFAIVEGEIINVEEIGKNQTAIIVEKGTNEKYNIENYTKTKLTEGQICIVFGKVEIIDIVEKMLVVTVNQVFEV